MGKDELTIIADFDAMIAGELERSPALKSAHTRRTYKAAISAFNTWRAGRPVTRLLLEQYAAELQQQGRAASTINHDLAALRWYARRIADLAAERHDIPAGARREMIEQAQRAATVRGVRGGSLQAGRYVTIRERQALIDVCATDPTPAGTRDAAILALAMATGARRMELAGLQLADVESLPDDGGGYRITFKVAKGDKPRAVDVTDPGACQYLRDWLDLRRGPPEPGPLFLAISKGKDAAIIREAYDAAGRTRRYTVRPGIGTQALQELLAKRAAKARVKDLGWHDFRRSVATDLIDGGVDLVLVAGILGHKSVETTAGYDRRPEAARRAALKKTVRLAYSKGKEK